MVAERLLLWEPAATDRGARLEHLRSDPEWVRVVPGHLDQMIDNLLANALEVAPAGSDITVAVKRAGANVEVHVLDRGPGLSGEDLEKAFHRFWRASPASGNGAGLGLAIVREMANANDGEAMLRPRDGGGLDAVIRFRRHEPPA
ncbi:MAG: sensor histidine kinase [Actinomycetota bacterium]